jgi:hypothetical protein
MGAYQYMMEGKVFIQLDHCHLLLRLLKLRCKMRKIALVVHKEAEGMLFFVLHVLRASPKFCADTLLLQGVRGYSGW